MSMTEMNFTIPSSISADKVTFDKTSTSLTSTDVQNAIKELDAKYESLKSAIIALGGTVS